MSHNPAAGNQPRVITKEGENHMRYRHRPLVPTLRVCVNAERPCGWAWFLYGIQRVG